MSSSKVGSMNEYLCTALFSAMAEESYCQATTNNIPFGVISYGAQVTAASERGLSTSNRVSCARLSGTSFNCERLCHRIERPATMSKFISALRVVSCVRFVVVDTRYMHTHSSIQFAFRCDARDN